MSKYRRVPQRLPETYRRRAAASISAERPSGKAPTTRVRRQISRMIRSNILFVRICR